MQRDFVALKKGNSYKIKIISKENGNGIRGAYRIDGKGGGQGNKLGRRKGEDKSSPSASKALRQFRTGARNNY